MKIITSFASAAWIAAAMLAGSAQLKPATAGNFDWLGTENYVRCLKYVSALAESAAGLDRGRRACNRAHYPGRPGYDY